MGALSPAHLILILAVAILVIGPGKLPETGAAIGKAIRQFREAANGLGDGIALDGTLAPAAPVVPPFGVQPGLVGSPSPAPLAPATFEAAAAAPLAAIVPATSTLEPAPGASVDGSAQPEG